MTLYALKRYPDNLSAVIDTLDKELASVSDFNPIMKATGWLLRLEEDQIPEHTLTVILMMISGYASKIELPIKDPAVGLYNVNLMYPHVMKSYPYTTDKPGVTFKTRYGYSPDDTTLRIYTGGDVPVDGAIDETVPEKTLDRSGEISEAIEITSDPETTERAEKY